MIRILSIALTAAFCFCNPVRLSGQHLRLPPDTGRPVIELPFTPTSHGRPGWEERGPEWVKWLAVGVRFSNGSGTICHYDASTGYAYVISCGHLFRGKSLTYEEAKRNPRTREIDVFYHNHKKLDEPRSYQAEVLCYRNFSESVYDVALVRFKPDWNIEWYAPLAERHEKLTPGQKLHSTGCDGLTPVAHYLIEYIEERERGNVTEIVTQENNPRGGRSGGGVMLDNGHLVAICSRGGGGKAWWTSLQQMYKFLGEDEKEFAFLLDARTSIARRIPIVDPLRPGAVFHQDYIPIP